MFVQQIISRIKKQSNIVHNWECNLEILLSFKGLNTLKVDLWIHVTSSIIQKFESSKKNSALLDKTHIFNLFIIVYNCNF